MGTFEVGLNAFLNYDMTSSLWELGTVMWWFEKKRPPKGVALLEEVWVCCRKAVTVEVDFEVSSLASISETVSKLPATFCSRCNQHHVCLSAAMLSVVMKMD